MQSRNREDLYRIIARKGGLALHKAVEMYSQKRYGRPAVDSLIARGILAKTSDGLKVQAGPNFAQELKRQGMEEALKQFADTKDRLKEDQGMK